MVCPVCNIEARITKVTKEFNLTEQKFYTIKNYTCENKKCSSYGQQVGQEKTQDPSVVVTP